MIFVAGFLFCLAALILMVVVAPYRFLRKRPGGGKAWVAGMGAAVIGIACFVTAQLSAPQTVRPKLSAAEWKKHRSYIEAFERDVLNAKSSGKIYAAAFGYQQDGYIRKCKDPGCSEFRQLLKEVIAATGDGFISPKENQEIIEWARFVHASLDKGELELATTH